MSALPSSSSWAEGGGPGVWGAVERSRSLPLPLSWPGGIGAWDGDVDVAALLSVVGRAAAVAAVAERCDTGVAYGRTYLSYAVMRLKRARRSCVDVRNTGFGGGPGISIVVLG